MAKEIQKLPDPQGMIARVKGRMSRNCAVRKSRYCDIIISMRMQGIAYRQIEAWLIEQGEEYRISSATILRNLKKTKLQVELPYAEEMAEKWGERIDLDYARELAGQIVAQRQRVDKMQRLEIESQTKNSRYFDRRLKPERELLTTMIKALAVMMKTPLEAAQEAMAAEALMGAIGFQMSEDATAMLKDLLISGELKYGEVDETELYSQHLPPPLLQ